MSCSCASSLRGPAGSASPPGGRPLRAPSRRDAPCERGSGPVRGRGVSAPPPAESRRGPPSALRPSPPLRPPDRARSVRRRSRWPARSPRRVRRRRSSSAVPLPFARRGRRPPRPNGPPARPPCGRPPRRPAANRRRTRRRSPRGTWSGARRGGPRRARRRGRGRGARRCRRRVRCPSSAFDCGDPFVQHGAMLPDTGPGCGDVLPGVAVEGVGVLGLSPAATLMRRSLSSGSSSRKRETGEGSVLGAQQGEFAAQRLGAVDGERAAGHGRRAVRRATVALRVRPRQRPAARGRVRGPQERQIGGEHEHRLRRDAAQPGVERGERAAAGRLLARPDDGAVRRAARARRRRWRRRRRHADEHPVQQGPAADGDGGLVAPPRRRAPPPARTTAS